MEQLNASNPKVTEADRQRVQQNIVAFRLANNRRVDLSLSTTGQVSQRFFPYNSDDLNVLLGEQRPVVAKIPTRRVAVKKMAARK